MFSMMKSVVEIHLLEHKTGIFICLLHFALRLFELPCILTPTTPPKKENKKKSACISSCIQIFKSHLIKCTYRANWKVYFSSNQILLLRNLLCDFSHCYRVLNKYMNV